MISIFLLLIHLQAKDVNFFSSNDIDPNDYLFGSHMQKGDPVFNTTHSINLDIDIGIGSDCGRINIKNTLNGSLNKILSYGSEYFKGIGTDILKAAPMLTLCYASPTWCAILKHAQLKANFLAELRLNQCKAINRFVDNRVSDYYEERSSCVQNAIRNHDGNFENAMESCSNSYSADMKDWAGSGNKKTTNKLIDSTVKWAGMNTARGTTIANLTKAFVGDTIIKQGNISVDFGPRKVQLSPRAYLMEIKSKTHKKLCETLIPQLIRNGGHKSNIYRTMPKHDLPVDHQTILSLMHFPYKKRILACKKLSDAIAMGTYTEDMGQTVDFLSSTMMSNPHLPMQRKKEVELKRRAFKDHVEMTLALEKQTNEPLNNVLQQINTEGQQYIKTSTKREISNNQEQLHSQRINEIFFDGADGRTK